MRAISSQHLLQHRRSKTLTDAAAFFVFALWHQEPRATLMLSRSFASENLLAIMPTFGAPGLRCSSSGEVRLPLPRYMPPPPRPSPPLRSRKFELQLWQILVP